MALTMWQTKNAVMQRGGTVFMTEPGTAGSADKGNSQDEGSKEEEESAVSERSPNPEDSDASSRQPAQTIGVYPNAPVLKFYLTTKCMHQLIFQACLNMNPDMESLLKAAKKR